jgi:hypothetical protein
LDHFERVADLGGWSAVPDPMHVSRFDIAGLDPV